MHKPLSPQGIHPPFAPYSHGIEVDPGARYVFCSGQLGISADSTVPADCGTQTRLCFDNIRAILAEAGMGFEHVVRLNTFVTGREHLKAYMDVRNSLFGEPYPASTLMIVSGFARPEFVIEIEAIARSAGAARMSKRKIWWTDFAASDFKNIDPVRSIAVFPTAAVEQHGPHLPVGTDTIINQGHLDLLIERLPEDIDIRILPIQAIGKSNEHIWQVGTISGMATTLIDHWTQIGLEVARAGFRKIVFVNSHGGNVSMLDIIARELRVRADMLAVKAAWSHFWPKELYSDMENRHGIHGGDAETSLVLNFRPELVDMVLAEDFASVAARDEQAFKYLRPTGMLSYAWVASDINPSGAAGEASKATAEKGRATAEAAVDGFIELLREVERKELPAPHA